MRVGLCLQGANELGRDKGKEKEKNRLKIILWMRFSIWGEMEEEGFV